MLTPWRSKLDPAAVRRQPEVADSLAQDVLRRFFPVIPVNPSTRQMPPTRRAGWTLRHFEQLVLEAVLAKIPAPANRQYRQYRLLVDLSVVMGCPGFQPRNVAAPAATVVSQLEGAQNPVADKPVRSIALLVGGQAAPRIGNQMTARPHLPDWHSPDWGGFSTSAAATLTGIAF